MAEKTVATRSQQSMTPSREVTRSQEQYVRIPRMRNNSRRKD